MWECVLSMGISLRNAYLFFQAFHSQFLLFAGYICLVQQLQYQYQSGCLRRLHSLGHGDSMDVTLGELFVSVLAGFSFLQNFRRTVRKRQLKVIFGSDEKGL